MHSTVFSNGFSLGLVVLAACAASDDTGTLSANLASDTLPSGGELLPGDELVGADGRLRLTYQLDGNLVLTDAGRPIWHTNTWGTEPGRVAMQTDGNLVVYDAGGTPRWWSSTFRTGVHAKLGWDLDQGYLVLCWGGDVLWGSHGRALCSTSSTPPTPGGGGPPNILGPGERLNPNDSRATLDGRFRLTYQADGNLVLTDGGSPVWHSGTFGTSPGHTAMQPDGNLVVYDASGAPRWSSNTFRRGSELRVNYDHDGDLNRLNTGNLTMCDGSYRVWGTNTNQNGCRTPSPGGGGGPVDRPCSSLCTGCMVHEQCLRQADNWWETCESTGFYGSGGSCYRLNAVPENCNEFTTTDRRCWECADRCNSQCGGVSDVCMCTPTGRRDRGGNDCCVMHAQAPYCTP